jgi:hypothetical protein
MSGHRHVAGADSSNGRMSVFSVEGEFVRHVGVGVLRYPTGVACSALDELVIAEYVKNRVVVFSASGVLTTTMAGGGFSGVAMHSGTIFAQTLNDDNKCVVFT